jgi:endo-1,4-beta-D-glucanase Y
MTAVANASGGAGTGAVNPTGGAGNVDPSQPSYGYSPSTVTVADAQRAYQTWQDRYLTEACGNQRVQTYAYESAETFSEGIGYGMLLTVAHDDQATFDGLWSFYQANLDPNGLMHWKIGNCNDVWGENAATDGDLDAAMALIQASCKWGGSYGQDATDLINKIKQHETSTASGLNILHPGDVWGGAGCMNPSYFAPGYYRAFANHVPADAAFWNKLADDSYTILERAANATTGLVPDWTDINGTPGGSGDNCSGGGDYYYDAARTPWRIATDYVWWGTPAAKTWLDRLTDWVDLQGIAQIGDGYTLTGSQTSGNHNSTFVGAFATAAMAHSQDRANRFATDFAAITDDAYFQETLRALYFSLLVGLFPAGC